MKESAALICAEVGAISWSRRQGYLLAKKQLLVPLQSKLHQIYHSSEVFEHCKSRSRDRPARIQPSYPQQSLLLRMNRRRSERSVLANSVVSREAMTTDIRGVKRTHSYSAGFFQQWDLHTATPLKVFKRCGLSSLYVSASFMFSIPVCRSSSSLLHCRNSEQAGFPGLSFFDQERMVHTS